jgi:2-iminobutanoate/2-iminopropanoate deaminase
MRHFTVLALGVLTVACTAQAPGSPMTTTPPPLVAAAPEFINVVEPWPYPFSSAVRAGDFLFLSGQIGSEVVDGAPKLVAGGIEAETRQTLENIKTILAKGGSSLDKVVKCSVMIADMAEWPKMNAVYATYFPGNKPARSAWGANGLALGARVEIECIALAH